MTARRPRLALAGRPRLAFIDDLMIEILLRLRPDDTACLARASLVCKAWRRLLSDCTFPRRYREIHGAPPVLGFLYNQPLSDYSTGASDPLFLRTKQLSPFPALASTTSPTNCRTLDCRHGRVLLHHPGYHPISFTVWDPITGKTRYFLAPRHTNKEFTAAVLCASSGCDHISCNGGPFIVVLVQKTSRHEWQLDAPRPRPMTVAMALASLYSSETGKWSVSTSVDFNSFTWTATPSLLAGDALFFCLSYVGSTRGILKYDLTTGVLSAICAPPIHHKERMILCTAEDGGLGVASVEGCSLRLLSCPTDPDGATRWAQDRAIKLDSVNPSAVGGASTKFHVVGFAEGTGYVFVWANGSIFSVELKSGSMSKISSGNFHAIFPFMRF